VGVLLYLEPKITVVCVPLYPILRVIGRRRGWRQEGAIASLTTMAVLATVVLVSRGLAPGLFAYVLVAVVVFRHKENLREIFADTGNPVL
jgi:glycerol-3-phosphate acyltransferase PlsY